MFKKIIRNGSKIIFYSVLIGCLVCDFFITKSLPRNADLLQTYSQMWAVRNGNILLHGWTLSADNFYFTDLPFMVCLSYIFGTGLQLVYIAPLFVFCLLLVAALLLVARAAETCTQKYFGMFAVLSLIGLPFAPLTTEFFQPAIHIGTVTLSLYAILLIDSIFSDRKFNSFKLIPFSALVFAIIASDPMANVFFISPLLIFIGTRALIRHRLEFSERTIFLCAILFTTLGMFFPKFIKLHGGFSVEPTYSLSVVPPYKLFRDIIAVKGALQVLFTARPNLFPEIFAYKITGLIRYFIEIVIIILAFWSLIRLCASQKNGLSQFFAISAFLLIIGDILSENFTFAISNGVYFPGAAVRYVAPAYILLVLSGVVELQFLLSSIWGIDIRRTLMGGIYIASIPFLLTGTQVAIKDSQKQLGVISQPQVAVTQWLISHHFSYGTGEYWASQAVGPLSEGKIETAPVILSDEKLVPFAWNSDQLIWKKMNPPQFVVFENKNVYGVNLSSIIATYGKPKVVKKINGILIAIMVNP